MKRIITALAVSAALTITACSAPATNEPTTPPAEPAQETVVPAETTTAPTVKPTEESPTEYAFATGMTFGKVTTEGKPGKELKAFLDAAGESVGEEVADQFTYWTTKIDNREGAENAFPNEFRAYDEAGEEYLFVRALDIVEAVYEQLPDAPLDADSDSAEWKEYEDMFALYEAAFEAENYSAHPGAVKEFTLVTGDKLPAEISKMTIDLGGLIGEADVITMEDAESQGYPLDF